MYKKLQNIRDRSGKLEFEKLLRKMDVEELTQMIRERISSADAENILDDIFQVHTGTEVFQERRRKLVEHTLQILCNSKVTTRQADVIIHRIIADFPRYSKQHLVKLIDFCLSTIPDDRDELHCWKDLLPALLEALEGEKYVTYMDDEISLSEYKCLVVKSICKHGWNGSILPSLAKMFGEMDLEKSDRVAVLRALCASLRNLSPDQIPPFVYQMLKFCRHQDSKYLLDALRNFFDSVYSRAILAEHRDTLETIGRTSVREVRDAESTVLYYVYQAAQLNHENIKDVVRYLKNISCASDYILHPFVFSVLLSVSTIYEDQVFEILRLAIVGNDQDDEKRKNSAWLRNLLPATCDITRTIGELVCNSKKDRLLVLKGLAGLAFTLIGTDQKSKRNASSLQGVGATILRELMKKCPETTESILQEIIDKIIMGSIPTLHYTDCLEYACRKLTAVVLDHQGWIISLLDRLLFLPSTVATRVLSAIFPLMRVSPSIRENLILTLRKALYRKGTYKRQMAITGFLEMLKYLKIRSLSTVSRTQRNNSSSYILSTSSTSTLTQVTLERSSQKMGSFAESDKTLSCEILSILKKCFTYEFQVRSHLYKGLYDAALQNSEITEFVSDMLLSHMNLYLEVDESVFPPLKLDMCTDKHDIGMLLQEPIADLIFVMQKLYVETVSKGSVASDKLLGILESLSDRMAATEIKHFNLDDKTDLFDDVLKSQKKLEILRISITIYEALIAFRVGQWFIGNEDSARKINDLFEGYTRLVDFIKQHGKLRKGEGKGKKDKETNHTAGKRSVKLNNVKLPNTLMDLSVVQTTLSLLYSSTSIRSTQTDMETETETDAGTSAIALKQNYHFHRYILQICGQLLQQAKAEVDESGKSKNSCVNAYIEIGALLYKYPITRLDSTIINDEEVAVLAVECFREICCAMCTHYSSELTRFLQTVCPTDSIPADIDSRLQDFVLSLILRIKISFDEETNEDACFRKIQFFLLEVVQQLICKINFANCSPEKLLDRVRKMALMENVHSSFTTIIIQLILCIEERMLDYSETLNDISLELCEKLGTIDDTELVTSRQYKILRKDTATQVYNVLNGSVKEKLHSASWLLVRLKAGESIARAPGTIDKGHDENSREMERSLCKQLSYIIQVLHTLANTAIDPGICTDLTFRNLQQLYYLLGSLTKHFYAKSSGQNAAFQAVKFLQVVQLAGKPLKSAFYDLVTHVEENQNKVRSKSDSHAQRNKVLKETKIIPRVVYEIEQFNKEVLLLGKRTGVPLENYMKRSVTRDFRIKNPQLVEGLERMDLSMLVSQNSETTVEYQSRDSTINNSRNGADEEGRGEGENLDRSDNANNENDSIEEEDENEDGDGVEGTDVLDGDDDDEDEDEDEDDDDDDNDNDNDNDEDEEDDDNIKPSKKRPRRTLEA